MKGTNELKLSPADVQQAFQDWCDKHLVDKPQVIEVEMNRGGGSYGEAGTVTLKIAPLEAQEAKL